MRILTTEELADIPRPKWLIEDFIAEKATTMIYGPWGLGKSFMALDMALTATTGGDWNGRKIDRPLKIMFIVAEGAAWWYRRLLAYERERGAVDREMIVWIPEPVDLYNQGNAELKWLEEQLEIHDPDVLFIDTWVRCSAAYGMNENDATSTAMAYKNLDMLRDRHDVTPVIIHHPTKSGVFRGSGNQGASVERIISLEEVDGFKGFKVVDEKGNHTESFEDFRMQFQTVDLSDLSEDLTSAVVEYEGLAPSGDGQGYDMKLFLAASPVMSDLGFTTKQFKDMAVIANGSVSNALKSLVLKGLLAQPIPRGPYYLTGDTK